MSKIITISQVFYSGRAALQIELSKNGIFFTLAPALQKNEDGNMTYNWKEKITKKFSISETILIKKALITLFEEGIEAYQKLGFFISNNSKYCNMQFIHVTAKGESRMGLEAYSTFFDVKKVIDNKIYFDLPSFSLKEGDLIKVKFNYKLLPSKIKNVIKNKKNNEAIVELEDLPLDLSNVQKIYQYYDKVSFGIFKNKTESLKYPIQNMDYFRIIEFLEYITKQAFLYEALVIEEERIENIGKTPAPKESTIRNQVQSSNDFDKRSLAELLDMEISHLSEVNEKNDLEKTSIALILIKKAESLKDLKLIMNKFNGLMKRSISYRNAFNKKSQEILDSILDDIEKQVVSVFDKEQLSNIREKYKTINNVSFQENLDGLIANQEAKILEASKSLKDLEIIQKDEVKNILLNISKLNKEEAINKLLAVKDKKAHVLEKFPSLKREVANKLELLKAT